MPATRRTSPPGADAWRDLLLLPRHPLVARTRRPQGLALLDIHPPAAGTVTMVAQT